MYCAVSLPLMMEQREVDVDLNQIDSLPARAVE